MNIKNIASARSASQSDSDKSAMISRRKKAKTGGLRSNNSPRKAHDRHHGVHCYCVLCKKAGMPECKYTLHSSEDCTSVRTKRPIKYGMTGPMGSRTNDVQHSKKSETNVRRIWKLSRSRTRWYNSLPRNTARGVKSRRSGQKLLRGLESLPVMIMTPIRR